MKIKSLIISTFNAGFIWIMTSFLFYVWSNSIITPDSFVFKLNKGFILTFFGIVGSIPMLLHINRLRRKTITKGNIDLEVYIYRIIPLSIFMFSYVICLYYSFNSLIFILYLVSFIHIHIFLIGIINIHLLFDDCYSEINTSLLFYKKTDLTSSLIGDDSFKKLKENVNQLTDKNYFIIDNKENLYNKENFVKISYANKTFLVDLKYNFYIDDIKIKFSSFKQILKKDIEKDLFDLNNDELNIIKMMSI